MLLAKRKNSQIGSRTNFHFSKTNFAFTINSLPPIRVAMTSSGWKQFLEICWLFLSQVWQKSIMVTLKRKCHNSLVVVHFCMPCTFCHRYVDTLQFFSFWELHFQVHSVFSKILCNFFHSNIWDPVIDKDSRNENAFFPSITSSAESSSTTMQCPQVFGKDCFAKGAKSKKKRIFLIIPSRPNQINDVPSVLTYLKKLSYSLQELFSVNHLLLSWPLRANLKP